MSEPRFVVAIVTPRDADAEAVAATLDAAGLAPSRLAPERLAPERLAPARLGGAAPDAAAEAGPDAGPDGGPDAVMLDGLGCLVVVQEALTPAVLDDMARALDRQAPWSELPIIVLAAPEAPAGLAERLAARWTHARLEVHRRPLAPLALVRAVHAALRARARQFDLRDRLALQLQMQRETHHRLHNLLTTVQAMAAMSRRSGGDGTTALRDFEGRLRALASVHADLDESGRLAARFAKVAAGVLAPYGSDAETRVAIAAVDDLLTPQASRTFALCLHELATNALKYGALADPAGRVELRLERGDRGAALHWVEHGARPPAPPTGQGYGTRYLERALGQLFDAKPALSFAETGFRLDVEGPASRLFAD